MAEWSSPGDSAGRKGATDRGSKTSEGVKYPDVFGGAVQYGWSKACACV